MTVLLTETLKLALYQSETREIRGNFSRQSVDAKRGAQRELSLIFVINLVKEKMPPEGRRFFVVDKMGL